ncbi:MAG TPA: PEP-CTERM sorting domain-containing protein [Vicinamibacterales bacterium]|nr:PEP-CTERM sorting domain-containing protein [Vicinamibacterales bacterium]
MKTISSRLGTRGLAVGLTLFLGSAAAEAAPITITNITVTVGPFTYGPTCVVVNSTCTGWSFPVTLQSGQSLVLTQNLQGTPTATTSYNFDTSDSPFVANPALIPSISITANGGTTAFNDSSQVLNLKGQGAVSAAFNEAQNYGPALVGPGYNLFLGYADNVHPNPCGPDATSLGLSGSTTCFPSPFSGATFFQGRGALQPPLLLGGAGEPQTPGSNHCTSFVTGLADCYDAGVLRIVNTTQAPEPATMMLLLSGLAGLTARQYGRTRRRARDES